ncbi:protein ACN9-like protein, mitochondrial [Platysternon megacephalum]|uniref:Protein ACN9-like protein, mitochondrial n=1 Tax=Platysternon megacephalum TaxID=55544 RepID=A0A4D9EQ18_9SAUR|nr:protein ACN9-like protein, mitochondrial [Platysternon megacephalum]
MALLNVVVTAASPMFAFHTAITWTATWIHRKAHVTAVLCQCSPVLTWSHHLKKQRGVHSPNPFDPSDVKLPVPVIFFVRIPVHYELDITHQFISSWTPNSHQL